MKIYRVVFTCINIEESEHTVKIATFFNKENALNYYNEQLKELKEEQEELDMEYYCIDENETSYERYLDERYMEQAISLSLEEENTYDELIFDMQQNMLNEKDNEYEI